MSVQYYCTVEYTRLGRNVLNLNLYLKPKSSNPKTLNLNRYQYLNLIKP